MQGLLFTTAGRALSRRRATGANVVRMLASSSSAAGQQQATVRASAFRQDRRQQLTEAILDAKRQRALSWQQLAADTGLSLTYVTAALLGQHALSAEVAHIVGERLGLDQAAIQLLQEVPMRGNSDQVSATDPTIYRFHEMMEIYAPTLKALVHEQFGDGIISAVNFKIDLKKVADPEGGHRAVITLDGKFLPFKPF